MIKWSFEDLGPAKGIGFEIPICMDEFFRGRPRYRVVHGGRGSVKSWTIARALLVLALKKRKRILCAREFQKSLKESVHYLLVSQIDRLGLAEFFDVTDNRITCPSSGSEFIFAGLHHNIRSLKSLEQIDICWIEEAETVSQESWDVLDPTIRAPGSEIWISFNPKEEIDPIYKMFVKDPLPASKVLAVGWKDNPWLPEVLRVQAEWMREHDPERYEHIWGGKAWFQNAAQVLNGRWCSKDFDIHMTGKINISGPQLGVDFGFSQDPGCGTKSYVEIINPEDIGKTYQANGEEIAVPLRRNLYVAEEAYAMPGTPGIEITNFHAVLDTISEFRQYESFADSARPESVSHLVKVDGFCLMEPCEKWHGSVEDGISYLRGFERIFIHPSCVNMLEEARLWSFKTDPLTGKPLKILKPGYDHGWDATRYGHQRLITRTPTVFDNL